MRLYEVIQKMASKAVPDAGGGDTIGPRHEDSNTLRGFMTTQIIGFDGRSIAEMEENWKNIELFSFCEASEGNPILRAALIFAPAPTRDSEFSRWLDIQQKSVSDL